MAKCIRVLQVGMSEYYGGTESFIMSQYRAIDKSKVQFDFLNVYKGKIACQDEIEALGGKVYSLDMSRRNGLKAYYDRLDKFFEKYAECFDIVHCNYQSLINIDILKYAKKYGIKVRIAHAHNSGYGKEPNLLQKLIIAKNKKTVKRYATDFFACSPMASKWMFNTDSVIIKNAIDCEKFLYSENIREKVRTEMGLADNFVLLFVGRLDPQKNPLFLLEIFSQVVSKKANSRLLIVGDGALKEQMLQRVRELNIENTVEFLGSRSDVNELLQATDAFVLPSLFEGLGIVLIEAQSACVPTYTSNNVPIDAKISELIHFIPLEKSAEEWADIILRDKQSQRVNMRDVVCEHGYDNVANAKRLETLYKEKTERA